ncbi:MAG: hypothetical protein JBO36_05015 [Candidatus Thiodiazotropha taylori]|nr:hypothetical protein [Candidatus Thiodiazotropha taylori]
MVKYDSAPTDTDSAEPDIVFIQKLYSNEINYLGKNLRVDEEVDIGVHIQLGGITHTDKDHGNDVTIEKSKVGLFIMFHNGDMPREVSVFARQFGNGIAGCISAKSCPSVMLKFTCSARIGGGDHRILHAANNFISKCSLKS